MVPQPEAQDMLYFFHDAGWTVCCSIDFSLKCSERKFMNLHIEFGVFLSNFPPLFFVILKIKEFHD